MKKVIAIKSVLHNRYIVTHTNKDVELNTVRRAKHFNSFQDAENYLNEVPRVELPPEEKTLNADDVFGNAYVIEKVYLI